MNDTSLSDFLEDRLSWELAPCKDINVRGLAEDLADTLKSRGYCSDPYSDYERALMCPINKRRESYCCCTNCDSHTFCIMLRKEGYV